MIRPPSTFACPGVGIISIKNLLQSMLSLNRVISEISSFNWDRV